MSSFPYFPSASPSPGVASPASSSKAQLLSHHAIMAIVAPFSRRGYKVDLAASDRGQGLLAFRPVEIPAPEAGGHPTLKCTFRLERPHRLKTRVVRTLEAEGDRVAIMTAEGDDPAVLLEVVEQISPARHYHYVDGVLVTRSYRTEVWSKRSRSGKRSVWPRLTGAEARVAGLRLSATDTEGRTLDLRVAAREEGTTLHLPTDFLAVLGWRWRPLRPSEKRDVWVGSVRPSGPSSDRTSRLEAHLDDAVVHISQTLGAPPADFHRRHRGARWRATVQRLGPLLYAVGATVAIVSAMFLLPRNQFMHMVILHVFFGAVAVLRMINETWRLELPPPPLPLSRADWSTGAQQ